MTTKMKGLLKGLRYISQIFDNGNYKEQEMQIGYPTDVKHVAHIGWDGPSVNPPSWMNAPEFSSAPLSMNRDAKEITVAKRTSEDLNRTGAGIQDFLARDTPELPKTSSRRQPLAGLPSSFDSPTRDPPKQSRRQQSNSVLINSPTRDLSDEIKPRRRNKNSGISGLSIDSPTRDLSNETKLTGQNKNSIVNGLSIDSPTRDLSNETKPTRRNKNLGVNGISIDSPTRDLSNRTKSTRRSQNSGDGEVSINSPSRDLSDGSKPTRRNQNSSLGLDSLLQDSYAIPKQSRRRKAKGSSGGGSVRGSRLKEHVSSSYTSPFSDPGSGSGLIKNELCSSSVLKAVEEEKGGTGHYGISRGIHDL